MVDSILVASEKSQKIFDIPLPSKYILITMHRAENVDVKENLEMLIEVIEQSSVKFIFPCIQEPTRISSNLIFLIVL